MNKLCGRQNNATNLLGLLQKPGVQLSTTYTMLQSFQICNPLQTLFDFPIYTPLQPSSSEEWCKEWCSCQDPLHHISLGSFITYFLTSLSHRPTLITKSIVFWKIWNLFHEKCSSSSGSQTHSFCSNVLRHGGLRTWEKLAGLNCYVIELLAMCYCLCLFWLVGLSPSDISCRPFGRPICYKVMNLQLGNCPILAVWLGQPPTTNNTQTKYIQLA